MGLRVASRWNPFGVPPRARLVTRPHVSFPDNLQRLLAVANARARRHYAAETRRRNWRSENRDVRVQMADCVTCNHLWGECTCSALARAARGSSCFLRIRSIARPSDNDIEIHAPMGSALLTLESCRSPESDAEPRLPGCRASVRRLRIWQGIKCLLENYADAFGGIVGKPAP